MAATCGDVPALGIIGCGATYGGEMQHSVARADWSERPDGRAHITGRLGTIDRCWAKGHGELANPADIGLHQDIRGAWRQPAAVMPEVDTSAPGWEPF